MIGFENSTTQAEKEDVGIGWHTLEAAEFEVKRAAFRYGSSITVPWDEADKVDAESELKKAAMEYRLAINMFASTSPK